MRTWLFISAAAALLLLSQSCRWRELDYDYVPGAEFSVVFDWSDSGSAFYRPEGRTAAFYPAGGGEPVVRMSNSDTMNVRLEAGDYNAVFFNETFDDFDCISFDGQGEYPGLGARLKDGATGLGGDVLCVATLSPFAVGDNLPRVLIVRPVDVLSVAELEIALSGGEDVVSACAYVNGLAGGYDFFGGRPFGMFEYKADLEVDGGSAYGSFKCFGPGIFGTSTSCSSADCAIHFRATLSDGSAFETVRIPDVVEVGIAPSGPQIIRIEIVRPIEILTEKAPATGSGWVVDIGGWDEETIPV